MEESTTNALKDVYAFYCGETLSKEERNVFVNGTFDDVRRDFNNLMDYCANDVYATHQASGLYRLSGEKDPVINDAFKRT